MHRAAHGQVLGDDHDFFAHLTGPLGALARCPLGKDGVVVGELVDLALATTVLVVAVPMLVDADAHLGCRRGSRGDWAWEW